MLVLYATDLLFTSKVNATARAVGAALAIVRGVESLRDKLAAAGTAGVPRVALVIVDLDADDAIAAIEAVVGGTGGEAGGTASGDVAQGVSSSRPRVLAYVSHVRADLIAAARVAGADQVMARSAFVLGLEQIVRAAGGAG